MGTLRIPGEPEEVASSTIFQTDMFAGLVNIRLRGAARVSETVRGEAREFDIEDVEDDDIVELEGDGGVSLWMTFGQYKEDYGQGLARDGEQPPEGTVFVPTHLSGGRPSRGIVTWALKGLKVFKIDLVGMAADVTAAALAERLESQLKPGSGLYRCTNPNSLTGPALKPGEIPSGKRILIFIHGTASSTKGSFGGLTEDSTQYQGRSAWRRLQDHYGEDCIFAFEHRTLSQSPLQNALELLKTLPDDATVDLVSHSRGGLVGELVSRVGAVKRNGADGTAADPVSIDDTDFHIFKEWGRKHDVDRAYDLDVLEQLQAALNACRDGGLKIGRFVRVGCPARGTTLASGRLDRYLSTVLNLLGMIPLLKASEVYDLTKAFLLAVAKTRTDPEQVPGLEAQMPTSPLVAMVNRGDIELDSELTVIAGDIEGGSLAQKVLVLGLDAYYRDDHDIVVNTDAMYGGIARRNSGSRHFFDQGAEVNHFSYFVNATTANKLVEGLKDPAAAASGFQQLAKPPRRRVGSGSRGLPGGKAPTVYVLPGTMGSHLETRKRPDGKGDRVWLQYSELMFGGIELLNAEADNVWPESPIDDYYGDLIAFLEGSHEIVPYPYDWRRSVLEEGLRLGQDISKKIDETSQPIRIVAHSMGGLVVRAMISLMPDVWRQVSERPGSRFVMLGTPNLGSYAIPRVLIGQDKTIRQLETLDITNNMKEVLEIVSRLPGVLELLPAGEKDQFFEAQTWAELHKAYGQDWLRPRKSDLRRAKSTWAKILESPIDNHRMAYIAGKADATVASIRIDNSAHGPDRIKFMATRNGDGRVPWATGIPAGMKPWYMDVEHGDLANHAPSFPAILDILETGKTDLLSQSPPADVRDAEEVFELDGADVDLHPSEADLLRSLMGSGGWKAAGTERIARVAVSVHHGNLAFARYPVMIGHYEGDVIVGAERHLDNSLDGRLSERRDLGIYPGALRSAEVIFSNRKLPAGAVITGLGPVGKLSQSDLAAAIERGVLEFAVKRSEERNAGEGSREAKLSTLLIGSGEGGVSVHQSLFAIMHGLARANRVLAPDDRITELEFVELYEDVAIEAASALTRAIRDPRINRSFAVERFLKRLPGGRKKSRFGPDLDWWRRIQIRKSDNNGDNALTFTMLTDRARAEERPVTKQPDLVDGMIASMTRDAFRDKDFGATLFELMFPNEFKTTMSDRRNTILIVDDEAARVPWELLVDRHDREKVPLAIRSGLLRQRIETVYRDAVIHSEEQRILVVGDPPSRFVELPGAKREASVVGKMFRDSTQFEIVDAIGKKTDPRDIMNKLMSHDYKVLHLAGHGVYKFADGDNSGIGDAEKTGMVIGEGLYLTSAEVQQMRVVPDLVFLNCCHLGRDDPDNDPEALLRQFRSGLAASISTQLIRMGVRAVIAAGWVVDDEAAVTFAMTFYKEMLDGQSFSNAVGHARRETWEKYSDVNTWGAYQCYGDPDYRLLQNGRASGRRNWSSLVSPSQASAEAENIANDADTAAERDIHYLITRLTDLHDTVVTNGWGESDAGLLCALATAYGQLNMFDKAIACYRQSINLNKANASLRALEQLSNMEILQASANLLNGANAKTEDAVNKIDTALKRIVSICDLARSCATEEDDDKGRTVERLSLLGSGAKRKAWIADGRDRWKFLNESTKHYKAAYDLAIAQNGQIDPYPALNWAGIELVKTLLSSANIADEVSRVITAAREIASERDKKKPDFWNLIMIADARVLECLTDQPLKFDSRSVDEIVDAYLRAWDRGGSYRKYRSVDENLGFIHDMLLQAPKSKRNSVEPVAHFIEELRHELSNRILV